MDLHHLRYVVELGRTRHFTRAAERLGVAQPALSQSISRLERELGVKLFTRTSRRVGLTPVGAVFLKRADEILTAIDGLETTVQEHASVVRGRIEVGTMLFFGETVLPGIFADFHRRHPAVEIVLHHGNTTWTLDAIRTQQLDLGFVGVVETAQYPELRFVSLAEEEVAAALPPGHRLKGRTRIRVADLEDESLVGYEPGSVMHEILERAFATAESRPRIPVTSHTMVIARALVSAGVGISIGTRRYLESPGSPIEVVRFGPPSYTMAIMLAMSPGSDGNPAANALTRLVMEKLAPRRGTAIAAGSL